MRRPHKNFVVEYKGGSRRSTERPTSIWGNLDLKSISRDVEKEQQSDAERHRTATPTHSAHAEASEHQVHAATAGNLLLRRNGDQIAVPEDVKVESLSGALAPQTRGRQRSVIAEPPSVVMTGQIEIDAGQAKRTRQSRAENSASLVSKHQASRKNPKSRTKKSDVAQNVTNSVGADFDDLPQLEKENRRLRKLFAEKLRAENADLRRRLARMERA